MPSTDEISPSQETLRSGFSPDGQRIYLVFSNGKYRLCTRWVWLSDFDTLADAADLFEALEFTEGDLKKAAKIGKAEIRRVPRRVFGESRNSMSRICYLFNAIDRRLSGLRPVRCGSHGSVEKWVPS